MSVLQNTPKGEGSTVVRLPVSLLSAESSWISQQPEPRPSRPEEVHWLIERAIAAQQPIASLDQKIPRTKSTIATNSDAGRPSASKCMSTLRVGLLKQSSENLYPEASPQSTEGD